MRRSQQGRSLYCPLLAANGRSLADGRVSDGRRKSSSLRMEVAAREKLASHRQLGSPAALRFCFRTSCAVEFYRALGFVPISAEFVRGGPAPDAWPAGYQPGRLEPNCRRGIRCQAVAQVRPVFREDRRTFDRSGLPAGDLPSFQVRMFRLQTSLDELRDPDSTRFHDHEAAVQALRPLGKEFHDLVGER